MKKLSVRTMSSTADAAPRVKPATRKKHNIEACCDYSSKFKKKEKRKKHEQTSEFPQEFELDLQ